MILKLGATGSDVRHWQKWRGLTVDGDFGPIMLADVKAFQKENGLDVDGKIGPNTLARAITLGYKLVTVTFTDKPVQPQPGGIIHFEGSAREKINLARLAKVSPVLQTRVKKFLALAEADGQEIIVTQGLRTFAEQDKLYAQGRSRPGIVVTNARGGQSNHNYGMAVDVAPYFDTDGDGDKEASFDEKKYKFEKWAKEAGLSWGGLWKSFTDLPHLEIPGVPKPSILLATYRKGGLAAVWAKYGAA